MSEVLVVDEVNTLSVAYVAAPFGQSVSLPSAIEYSGSSLMGEQILGTAPNDKKSAIVNVDISSSSEQYLGIVRWGFMLSGEGGIYTFIEKGWDDFVAAGKVIDYADLPAGQQLHVRVRWSRSDLLWTCSFY